MFETLEETLVYLTRGNTHIFTQASIISKTTPNQSEIDQVKRIIPERYVLGLDFQLYNAVLINPNVQFSYALISKE